ncbi:hypothetical protein H4R99_004847 [Coemansia sp. RSA 1722]|nr:hypothetical protein LPJ57_001211 [Coemansia sp. RSA 486]KAJ2235437.1 hypothetical protein IWW45_002605 [Coemansia sp. RSA 485]KAJ2596635.1 hypothetical protein H4R99_004847 [Coemansia sp. RSA 1722]KAJ2600724.1 hypothetical protein GGF39_001622 [Coemansia sp. RSA 1721]KAJ2638018.1 hypothetical protein GGF40_001945 [Coemansia sp. RSA 1286]
MRFLSSLFVLGSGALTVLAHTHIRNIVINDVVYDRGEHILPYFSDFNFPVKDPLSANMTCRASNSNLDDTPAIEIAANEVITLEWHQETDRNSVAIQAQHDGPCLVYMALINKASPADLGWFKIYEEGYNNGKWCSTNLNNNGGQLNVTIPKDLTAGDYLLRGEIIALPEAERVYASDLTAGAQFYPNCVHLTVTGSGKTLPKDKLVVFPGEYSSTHPGILVNANLNPINYQIPGPDVAFS